MSRAENGRSPSPPSPPPPPPSQPLDYDEVLYVPRADFFQLTDKPGIDLFSAGRQVWGRMSQVRGAGPGV